MTLKYDRSYANSHMYVSVCVSDIAVFSHILLSDPDHMYCKIHAHTHRLAWHIA